MKVVALDPGVTTGYATGLIQDGQMGVVSGQGEWNHEALWVNLQISQPDIIVCESFEYRNRARPGLELYSRELIGVVNLHVQLEDHCELVMQTPAQGKSGYFTDKKLKGDRLYKPSRPHANDAVRHLLYWFVFGPGFQYNTSGYVPLA